MTTEEIVSILRNHKSRNPEQHTLWMIAVYLLRRRGYSISNIASAFVVHRDTVVYTVNKTKDLLSVKDKYAINARKAFQRHTIVLVPYFYGKKEKKVHFYVEIDDTKLL